MYLGLTADALLQSLKSDAWRFLKFLEVNDSVGCPHSLLELLSVLLVVVVSDVRPTPALHGRLQALVSMATSTATLSPLPGAPDVDVSETDDGDEVADAASRILAASFAQAMLPEGSAAFKPWDHLRRLVEARRQNSGNFASQNAGSVAGSSALRYSSLLKRIRGDAGGDSVEGKLDDVDEEAVVEAQTHSDRSLAEAWEEHGKAPLEYARNAFLHRAKIYEAFLTHASSNSHSALRLFSTLEDKLLRLKSSQSSLPPAFEVLQLLEPASYRFKEPPITFWDAYFEFTRVARAHCLEYVMETSSGFIRKRDFCTAAWLLAPFPQLKPLVILLCWEEFRRDVKSLQHLLDTLWKSYAEETFRDSSKVGDLLVDYWVEVLNYRLFAAGWISKVVVEQAQQAPRRQAMAPRRERKELRSLDSPRRTEGESEEATGTEMAGVGGVQMVQEVAADVLDAITSHSILYVMRPNLPMVDSHTLLSSLHSLPQLRQEAAALEHSYDLDLAHCYYTVRCAMYLIAGCVAEGAPAPDHKVIQDGIHELDSLMSCIERTRLKVSVFLFVSSLCFARHHHLQAARSSDQENFLVPPNVLLSLLLLLRHHLQPLAAKNELDPGLKATIQQLQLFTQEAIWRIFISLKDYFIYSQLAAPTGGAVPVATHRVGDEMAITEETASDWASAIGAVTVGEMAILEPESHISGRVGRDVHPLRQFCTPMDVPLSLLPSLFIPRMLSSPGTLLQRSLKMNDYALSQQLLKHFPTLRGGQVEAAVQIAEQFKELRQLLVNRKSTKGQGEAEDKVLEEEEQFNKQLGASLQVGLQTVPNAEGVATGLTDLLSSLSRPLLAFYVLVDLAVSAAPFSQMSTFLLKKGTSWLSEGEAVPLAMRSFFENWVERLCVLVEVRPELRDRASLASIILGIETLPSEPALLKSHLNRLHTQRHAILSLVESVDLVKKGQTSASQRTLVDFLSTAITSFNREEEDSSKDSKAPEDREEAVQISEGLGSSRYLLRFLEYLARVADLMHSASLDAGLRKPKGKTEATAPSALAVPSEKRETRETVTIALESHEDHEADAKGDEEDPEAAGVTKLFDVLAEAPKGIVARLLFELGGHRQALALSEMMNIDIVEVIVNSSFKWSDGVQPRGQNSFASLPEYPMSMEVVQYLAQHERELPLVLCKEAPLLATLACLECRGHRWPSWQMLHFAKEQSHHFPALHRWVEERQSILQAIQWVDASHPAARGLPPLLLGRSQSQEALADGMECSGYTEAEFASFSEDEQLALRAAGDDQEACMSAAYTQLVNALIAEGRHELALQICDEHLPVDSLLTDKVLHLYLNSPSATKPEMDAVHELLDHECMYRVKSHAIAAQLTLDRYKCWDVDTAVQTLSMCLQRIEQEPSGNTEASRAAALKQELRRILQRMVSFEKILQASEGRWQVWQEIEDMSKAQVSEAVEHLLSLQQHDMARTLAQMYGMTDPLHSLELSRLHYLFTTKNDKTNAVNRLLSLPPSQAVSFALQLLDMFDVIQHRALLCQMLLTQFQSWLSSAEEERLRVLLASLQLLQEVSETMKPHFLKLLRKPELIVESLLMNARVDLLKKFLEDFPEYRHDQLILRYARKALGLVDQREQGEDARAASFDVPRSAMDSEGLGGPWCLTGSVTDQVIRSHHHFEDAPSSHLAERILELCSDGPENAAACFHICNDLSLRLYDLTTSDASSSQPPAAKSARLLTFLIRRLLKYLQSKFSGAGSAGSGREVQLKLQLSCNNLDFLPRLWHVSGKRVSLAQLCDATEAAQLRDALVKEDHLHLALELCKRCSPLERSETQGWHISADPVREAQAVALQRLSLFEEARQEFSMTDEAGSAGRQASENALSAFEDAMRYPPLYDLAALEQQRSIYTFNRLQRKLYRSTATMASLPIFMQPDRSEEAVSVPVVPISQSPEAVFNAKAGAQNGTATAPATSASALEDRLRDALHRRSKRNDAAKVKDVQQTTLVNSVTFLTPPIHPSEMSRWSTLTDMVTLRNKTAKAGHPKADANSAEVKAPEEPKPGGYPGQSAADEKSRDKDRPEEGVVEEVADPVFEEEDDANLIPEISYDKLTMDMASVCCACSATLHNLRSPSNFWPEDRQTHSFMPASPMALPLAAPMNLAGVKGLGRPLSAQAFQELLQFQDKYGSAESLISLLVRERRLAKACQFIFSEKVDKRLFVDVVAHHCLAHNQFHELQKVILDFDPSLRRVQEYLNSVKDFLRDRRALDLLYSYEVFTKNYVNAGFLAVQLFVQSSTWDARVGHLQNAEAHLGFAHRKVMSKRKGESKDGGADVPDASATTAVTHEAIISGEAAGDINEAGATDIKRNLETVRIQRAVCEAMPTEMPQNATLFGDLPAQCEVAELLMVNGHFKLAQKVMDFLDLPAVELCIRASNQIATQQARNGVGGSIAPVVKFLQAIPKLPPVEWDSLVSNVVNIWIIEKEELNADRSAASQLVPFIQDERCKMDAMILIGNLQGAFHIAQRLGSMQDVLHINSRAQAVGDQELLKSIATFMAYNPVGKKR